MLLTVFVLVLVLVVVPEVELLVVLVVVLPTLVLTPGASAEDDAKVLVKDPTGEPSVPDMPLSVKKPEYAEVDELQSNSI